MLVFCLKTITASTDEQLKKAFLKPLESVLIVVPVAPDADLLIAKVWVV